MVSYLFLICKDVYISNDYIPKVYISTVDITQVTFTLHVLLSQLCFCISKWYTHEGVWSRYKVVNLFTALFQF